MKQLGRDFQERTFLHQRNKQKLSTTLLRIDNEILQGQRGRETDLTRVELEGLRDEERTLQDLNTLKGQIRHYGLEYRDLQRSLRLLPGAYINRQLILDLRPILPRPMGDLILLSYDAKTQHTILLEPPSKDECKGEFQLGSVVYDSKELREFSISREDLNRHLVVVGKSGEGKTSFVRLLLQGLLGKVPFLIFSFKKEYSYLTQRPNVKVIRWDQLTFNALRPPGNLKEWVANFSDSFCQETSLLIGSKSFLIDQLGYLLKHKDGAFPNLRDVITLLSTLSFSARQREAQYLSVVQNRLRSLAFSIPHIISCRDGVNLKSLLEGNVVIELDSLNLDSQNFIISTLLTWTFLYRISKNEKGKLRHVIIFDEAKRIFDRNKEKRVTEGLPQIDILTSQIREYGVGLVVLDQEASK